MSTSRNMPVVILSAYLSFPFSHCFYLFIIIGAIKNEAWYYQYINREDNADEIRRRGAVIGVKTTRLQASGSYFLRRIRNLIVSIGVVISQYMHLKICSR